MKEKYHTKTDEEIVDMVHKNVDGAIDFLIEKYKNLICKKARTLYLIGGDREDLIQEGMIGLYKAIRDYKEGMECTFFSFANLCVSRQMYVAIKASNRQKNMPLNTYVSFYEPIFEKDSTKNNYFFESEHMPFNNSSNPEEMMIDKESINVIEYELGRQLSSFEKSVLSCYLDGMKYVQIAKHLNRTPKSIDNALQRIKNKLSKILISLNH